jgi:hypothetical protein
MIPRLRMFTALLGLSLLLCATSSCDKGTSAAKTEVIVRVDSDMREDLAAIEVQILDAQAESLGSSYSFDLLNESELPLTFAVAPPANKVSGSFLVLVRGKGKSGALLVEAKGLFSFATGRTLGVTLWLLESCRGVICSRLQTCDASDMDAPSCGPVTALETHDAEEDDSFDEPVIGPPLTPPGSSSDDPSPGNSDDEREAGSGSSDSDASTSAASDASTSAATMDGGAATSDGGTATMDSGATITDSGTATRDATVDAGPPAAIWDQFNWDQGLWQ